MLVQSIPYPPVQSCGSPTLEYLGFIGNFNVAAGTTTNASLGFTAVEGDVIIGICTHDGASMPAGAMMVGGVDLARHSANPSGSLSYFVCEGGETTVGLRGPNTLSLGWQVQAWRGLNTCDLTAEPLVQTTGSTGMPNPGSITVASPPVLRFIAGALDDDEITMTAPSGFTNATARFYANSSSIMASAVDEVGGALDPAAFGGAGNDFWNAYHIAFNVNGLP